MQGTGDQQWVEEYVLSSLETMYAAFEQDSSLLNENQLFEMRYEDLVEEPVEKLREMYSALELGDFFASRAGFARAPGEREKLPKQPLRSSRRETRSYSSAVE